MSQYLLKAAASSGLYLVCMFYIAVMLSGCEAQKTTPELQRSTEMTAALDLPRAMAQRALDNPAFNWDSTGTARVTLYFEPASFAAVRATALVEEAEQHLQHALALLDESTFPHHLRLFYVESREEMAVLTGQERGPAGLADFESATVAVVLNAEKSRSAARHEIMHVVSTMRWGQPAGARTLEEWLPGGWLREGLATYADNYCLTSTIRETARAMYDAGDIIPVDSLAFAFLNQDDLSAYIQAGTLMQFLIETEGVEKYRLFWQGGNASFEAVYNRSFETLEAQWHAWLQASTPDASLDLERLRETGC